MNAREELFRRVSGAFVDEEKANKLLDAYRAQVLREAAAEIDAKFTGGGRAHYVRIGSRVLRRMAESRPTRQQEDPHDGPLSHDYTTPHDLPVLPHQQDRRWQ